MTREQAKQFLVSCGVTEPTDEQVTTYLNSVNGEIQKEKDKSAKYKADADKAKDLQKQLDDLQNEQLSDLERANKAIEDANKKIAELEAKEALSNQRSLAMEKFKITAEQAKEFCKDDGSFDFDILGNIISEKEKSAATAKEQELAKKATNPNGGSAGSEDDDKPADLLNAEKITFGSVSDNMKSAREYYK